MKNEVLNVEVARVAFPPKDPSEVKRCRKRKSNRASENRATNSPGVRRLEANSIRGEMNV